MTLSGRLGWSRIVKDTRVFVKRVSEEILKFLSRLLVVSLASKVLNLRRFASARGERYGPTQKLASAVEAFLANSFETVHSLARQCTKQTRLPPGGSRREHLIDDFHADFHG